jgi:hypothetical protein
VWATRSLHRSRARSICSIYLAHCKCVGLTARQVGRKAGARVAPNNYAAGPSGQFGHTETPRRPAGSTFREDWSSA